MKKAIFSLIIICPYLLSASELEWQAEFRYRMMQDRTSSVANTETYNEPSTYSLLRSRIFFKLINGPVSMNLQLQDSRILGYSSNNPGLTKEDETIPSFHRCRILEFLDIPLIILDLPKKMKQYLPSTRYTCMLITYSNVIGLCN